MSFFSRIFKKSNKTFSPEEHEEDVVQDYEEEEVEDVDVDINYHSGVLSTSKKDKKEVYQEILATVDEHTLSVIDNVLKEEEHIYDIFRRIEEEGISLMTLVALELTSEEDIASYQLQQQLSEQYQEEQTNTTDTYVDEDYADETQPEEWDLEPKYMKEEDSTSDIIFSDVEEKMETFNEVSNSFSQAQDMTITEETEEIPAMSFEDINFTDDQVSSYTEDNVTLDEDEIDFSSEAIGTDNNKKLFTDEVELEIEEINFSRDNDITTVDIEGLETKQLFETTKKDLDESTEIDDLKYLAKKELEKTSPKEISNTFLDDDEESVTINFNDEYREIGVVNQPEIHTTTSIKETTESTSNTSVKVEEQFLSLLERLSDKVSDVSTETQEEKKAKVDIPKATPEQIEAKKRLFKKHKSNFKGDSRTVYVLWDGYKPPRMEGYTFKTISQIDDLMSFGLNPNDLLIVTSRIPSGIRPKLKTWLDNIFDDTRSYRIITLDKKVYNHEKITYCLESISKANLDNYYDKNPIIIESKNDVSGFKGFSDFLNKEI